MILISKSRVARRACGSPIRSDGVQLARLQFWQTLTGTQTVSNACASVALLNIVNNIPEIDLGEPLRQFRHYTENFTPALRGDAIGNFHFVKQVHNSFARSVSLCCASKAHHRYLFSGQVVFGTAGL